MSKFIMLALLLLLISAASLLHFITGGYSMRIAVAICERDIAIRWGDKKPKCFYLDDHGFFLLQTNRDKVFMQCDRTIGIAGVSPPFNCNFSGGE